MNVPEYPYFVYLPSSPPTPPPGSPVESPLSSPRDLDPVLDTAEEIEKWIISRKKRFPSRLKIIQEKSQEEQNIDRGDLSKLEIRMRKRMALMRKFYKKTEDKPGKNPFSKYMHLRKKLTNNTILKEQRVLLQCIKFVVDNNFLEENN
jgi:hypothetical protein